MPDLLIHGHLIVDGNREYLDGAILVDKEKIVEVFPQSDKITDLTAQYPVTDLKGKLVMPGYFDTHAHGGCGFSFDDADSDQFDIIANEYARSGTTAYLATLSYALSTDGFIRQLDMIESYEGTGSRLMGVHLEGPFLNREMTGAGSAEMFMDADPHMVESLLEHSSKIRQMTIACEMDNAKEVSRLLKEKDIRVMCGHSLATYDDLDENVDGFTHLFNAMKPLHHRDINLVNCAFMNRWYCEVIADGIHIDENVLRLIFANIDRDKLMLISDSSVARGMPDGEYTFLSRKCIRKDNRFMTCDGHLAGSCASINDELKLLYKMGMKYTDLLLYSGLNAYRFYGLDSRFGTIENGKYCDLVISDDELNISNVLLRGEFLYD